MNGSSRDTTTETVAIDDQGLDEVTGGKIGFGGGRISSIKTTSPEPINPTAKVNKLRPPADQILTNNEN